jgi:hypothetical protein
MEIFSGFEGLQRYTPEILLRGWIYLGFSYREK